MKQLLKKMYIDNKRILLRCDFNVPTIGGNITDESKIIKSLETINYLLSKNCKIIILSHLGRIKSQEDMKANSLLPIKAVLERLLNQQIKFATDLLSEETKNMALNLQSKEILLLENTRFLDIPNNLESNLNLDTAKKLSELGEVYVFDAFAVAHRNHTTIVGIPKYLPSCLGLTAEKEIAMLDKFIKKPEKPFTVLMGGSKVDDKLKVISALLPKCDHLLVSGGIANSFLSALGLNVGSSLKTQEKEIEEELKKLMLTYKEKFALPLDAICEATYQSNITIKAINKIDDNDIIKDIGTKTVEKYSKIIQESNTIFMNGPVGVYEEKEYANGTILIFNALKAKKDQVIIGGGDTVGAINTLGFKDVFKNISSGGGATLDYIAYGSLPGIDALGEEDEIEVLDL